MRQIRLIDLVHKILNSAEVLLTTIPSSTLDFLPLVIARFDALNTECHSMRLLCGYIQAGIISEINTRLAGKTRAAARQRDPYNKHLLYILLLLN